MDYRQIPHVSNEKGIALVIALLITTILLLMAITLSYNMASYLKLFAATKEKTQTYYTTIVGAEQLRDDLWNNTCIPPNWCGRLGVAADITIASYQNITAQITTTATPQFAGIGYTIYFKDNEDGDNNFTSDNDQIVLASIVSNNPASGSTTTVEAMLIFSGGAQYKQGGGGASKENRTFGEQGPDVTTQRQTFN